MTDLEKRHSELMNLLRDSWEADEKIRKERNRPFYVSNQTIRYQEEATRIQCRIISEK